MNEERRIAQLEETVDLLSELVTYLIFSTSGQPAAHSYQERKLTELEALLKRVDSPGCPCGGNCGCSYNSAEAAV